MLTGVHRLSTSLVLLKSVSEGQMALSLLGWARKRAARDGFNDSSRMRACACAAGILRQAPAACDLCSIWLSRPLYSELAQMALVLVIGLIFKWGTAGLAKFTLVCPGSRWIKCTRCTVLTHRVHVVVSHEIASQSAMHVCANRLRGRVGGRMD